MGKQGTIKTNMRKVRSALLCILPVLLCIVPCFSAYAIQWEWQFPLPHGENLHAISAAAPDAIWAVSDGGLILFYNGSSWTIQYRAPFPHHTYTDICAKSESSIWIAGHRQGFSRFAKDIRYPLVNSFDGRFWKRHDFAFQQTSLPNSLHAFNHDSIWIGCEDGRLYHYDGQNWAYSQRYPPNAISCVKGHSAGHLWMTSRQDGQLHYYNGWFWSLNPFDYFKSPLTALSLIDDTRLWAVGEQGRVVYFDGFQVQELSGFTNRQLRSVHASSESEVWTCGEKGELWHYLNGTWNCFDAGTRKTFNDIETISSRNLWAVGNDGLLAHYNGNSWELNSPLAPDLHRISGCSAGDLWAVGDEGTVMKYQQGRWQQLTPPNTIKFNDVQVISHDDLWVAGHNQLWHYNGHSWTLCLNNNHELRALQVQMDGTIWVAAAYQQGSRIRGGVWYYDGYAWSFTSLSLSEGLNDIEVISPNNVWVAGKGTSSVYNYNGQSWRDISPPGQVVDFKDLTAFGTNKLWALDAMDGRLWQFNGLSWRIISWAPKLNSYHAVSGNLVWGVCSSNDPGCYFYNGYQWNKVEGVSARQFNDIYAISDDEFWIVGEGGSILHAAQSVTNPLPNAAPTATPTPVVKPRRIVSGLELWRPPTPTPTPMPDPDSRPEIEEIVAFGSIIRPDLGGQLQFIAKVNPSTTQSQVDKVLLRPVNLPPGATFDSPWMQNDMLHTVLYDNGTAPGDTPGDYFFCGLLQIPPFTQDQLLELVAIDQDGMVSEPFLYSLKLDGQMTRFNAGPTIHGRMARIPSYSTHRSRPGNVYLACQVLTMAGTPFHGDVRIYYEGLPTSIALSDDGQSPDPQAGDGIYVVEIPAGYAACCTEALELTVMAKDAQGRYSNPWIITVHF